MAWLIECRHLNALIIRAFDELRKILRRLEFELAQVFDLGNFALSHQRRLAALTVFGTDDVQDCASTLEIRFRQLLEPERAISVCAVVCHNIVLDGCLRVTEEASSRCKLQFLGHILHRLMLLPHLHARTTLLRIKRLDLMSSKCLRHIVTLLHLLLKL